MRISIKCLINLEDSSFVVIQTQWVHGKLKRLLYKHVIDFVRAMIERRHDNEENNQKKVTKIDFGSAQNVL